MTDDFRAMEMVEEISIHTLAWRVTGRRLSPRRAKTHFNPHPRVEGDRNIWDTRQIDSHFNPHPRVEGDGDELGTYVTYRISIHTLAWRVTAMRWFLFTMKCNFNPHPRVEGDLSAAQPRAADVYFNPHPRVEGDNVRRYSGQRINHFNPHPRVEGDAWP